MNRLISPIILSTALALACQGSAAQFSSTNSMSRYGRGDHQYGINDQVWFTAGFNRPPQAGGTLLGGGEMVRTTALAGTNSVTLTVDTTTNKARYDDVDFLVPSLTPVPKSGMETVAVDFTYQLPPDFPNPPETVHVMGNYSASITVDSVAATTPTYVSGVFGNEMTYIPNLMSFVARGDATLNVPNISISGTYAVTGPMATISQPFTVVYQLELIHSAVFPSSLIPLDPSFGDGFAFEPYSLEVRYRTQASTIFNQIVDEVRIVISARTEFSANYFAPEPSAAWLATLAAGGLAWRRRRM